MQVFLRIHSVVLLLNQLILFFLLPSHQQHSTENKKYMALIFAFEAHMKHIYEQCLQEMSKHLSKFSTVKMSAAY